MRQRHILKLRGLPARIGSGITLGLPTGIRSSKCASFLSIQNLANQFLCHRQNYYELAKFVLYCIKVNQASSRPSNGTASVEGPSSDTTTVAETVSLSMICHFRTNV